MNKHFSATSFSSTNTILTQDFTLPTVSSSNNTGMDFFTGPPPDNYDEVRGRSLSTKEHISRDSSISSTKSSIAYYDKMECNNAMVIDEEMVNGSPALSYETDQEKALHISKANVQQDNMRFKCDNLNSFNFNP